MKLVIVESPTKAKTITKFLGKDFTVESSFGHIRDLPKSATEIPAKYKGEKWARLGINIEQDFEPLYIVPKDKKKQVTKLKQLIAKADEIYLATDEDREGEAISWHLLEVFKPTIPVHRMVFHEITKEAIAAALENARDVNSNLVQAQETRRILDRLYGYEISPVLWRKVAPKLSAGRVQSVAMKLIVDRERERMQFVKAGYWDVIGDFTIADQTTVADQFAAKLVQWQGKRIAIGKDFDGTTGQLSAKAATEVVIIDETTAKHIADSSAETKWSVTAVQQKPLTLRPQPPFITSTLQQEAGRKLQWSARQVMQVAQKLYEQGYITYMRTDSITLSDEALQAAKKKILELFGADYIPDTPRVFKGKSKNAQEAHEAIRPAGKDMRSPQELSGNLTTDELKLYDVIWKRTMASQMSDAKVQQTSIQLTHDQIVFQANGRVVEFPGYLKVYRGNSGDTDNDQDIVLPALQEGDVVTGKTFTPQSHETKSPARYTEASLVKELEQRGIGRPSTYATIIDTIQRRLYVYKEGGALIPRFTAFAVGTLLENNFPNLVNTEYTANMEEDLDEIAAGQKEYLPYLKQFYFGTDAAPGLHNMLQIDIDARATCTIPIGQDKDGNAINVRVGRYGPFVEQVINGETDRTASIPEDLPPDQLTVEMALEFMDKQAAGPTPLGVDPETDKPVYVLEGRYGPYVQLGDKPVKPPKEDQVTETADTAQPQINETKKSKTKKPRVKKPKIEKPKMKGLLPGMTIDDVTLEVALNILAFPKKIGVWHATQEDIIADNGRFGSYIRCGDETRSLSAEQDLLELDETVANVMLDTPKIRGRRAKKTRDVGKHPADEKVIALYDGRYGPYLKYGTLNVSVPDTLDPKTLTVEQAVELITAKQDKS